MESVLVYTRAHISPGMVIGIKVIVCIYQGERVSVGTNVISTTLVADCNPGRIGKRVRTQLRGWTVGRLVS